MIFRVGSWCERRDSNSHALASASPSSWVKSRQTAADLENRVWVVSLDGRSWPIVVACPDFSCTELHTPNRVPNPTIPSTLCRRIRPRSWDWLSAWLSTSP